MTLELLQAILSGSSVADISLIEDALFCFVVFLTSPFHVFGMSIFISFFSKLLSSVFCFQSQTFIRYLFSIHKINYHVNIDHSKAVKDYNMLYLALRNVSNPIYFGNYRICRMDQSGLTIYPHTLALNHLFQA